MSPKRTFGERVNTWLQEPPGAQFSSKKWKFWYLTLCGFQLLNAALTALVFSAGGQLQNAMGAVVLAVGGLLAWLGVAFMHYSDSGDRQLAYRVSVLDSITLICVLAHFSFLAWTFGHLKTIQSAESKYEAQATAYNAQARQVSTDNVAIAQAAQDIARENTKRARLENDSIYQARKAAESGAVIRAPRNGVAPGVGPALATSAVELERPRRPDESSAQFLSRWDSAIRLANLAELILAAVTLIYIRVRSSKTNSPAVIYDTVEEFPHALEVEARTPQKRENFTKKKDTAKTHASFNSEGLRRLRETLRDISFRLHKFSFKVDIRGDAVWVRMVYARSGTQETAHSARAKLSILDDAMTMPREAYRARLEKFLKQNSFEL